MYILSKQLKKLRKEVQMSKNKEVIQVVITENPPEGTWCFGMKGKIFNVVDKGAYYLLHEDIKKTDFRRCIVKSHADLL